MNITKEQLITQRARLVSDRQRHTDDAIACNGAIQIVDNLLALIDKPDPKAAPSAPMIEPSIPDKI
jgi:hypothetical protein